MIRQLGTDDAMAFYEFRRRSLLDAPLALTASPGDDIVSPPEAAAELLDRAPRSGCLRRLRWRPARGPARVPRRPPHQAFHIGHVWGMYVAPAHRGCSFAAKLLGAVIAHARCLPAVEWLQLSVSSSAQRRNEFTSGPASASWGRSLPLCVSATKQPSNITWPCSSRISNDPGTAMARRVFRR